MGNLPHVNIKINAYGNIEREEKFNFWKFYNTNADKEEVITKLKIKERFKNEQEHNDCC